MAQYIIDIERRLSNIRTFIVDADDYEEAKEKAMESAIQFNWPEPDHEEMAILFVGEA